MRRRLQAGLTSEASEGQSAMEMVILYWVLLEEEMKGQAFPLAPLSSPPHRLCWNAHPALLAGLLARLDAHLPMLLAHSQDGVAVGCREGNTVLAQGC